MPKLKTGQHDDHCTVGYNGQEWRIKSIHKGIAEVEAVDFCPGCQEHHEDFIDLSSRWTEEYSQRRGMILKMTRLDDCLGLVTVH